MPSAEPLLVEITRSGVVESTHLVDVAVVDDAGTLVCAAGDASLPAAFRSSAKPLQALASLEAGWTPADDAALAIACASHNGEPAHLDAVRAVLAAAGLDPDALACPPAFPFRPEDTVGVAGPDRLMHNCSGKHAAFVAACRAAGWDITGYRSADHPMQRAMLRVLTEAAGCAPDALLVDGCGVPTPVFPLMAIARAFACAGATPAAAAMRTHPFLVAGTDRLDTGLLELGILTKAGAEGLSCALVETADGPRSIAMKVRDGAPRARGPALTHALEALAPGSTTGLAEALRAPESLGDGRPVGRARATGMLGGC